MIFIIHLENKKRMGVFMMQKNNDRNKGKRKKSSRNKNLKMQMHWKIDKLLRIGESKHEAKKEYRAECEEKGLKWNPSKSNYIHSIKTTELYRDSVNDFSSWLKENKSDVWNTKDLNSITKDICYEYLREKDDMHSAWTTSRHMAAINKVLDLGLNKKEGDLNKRSYKDIKRSRTTNENNFKYNPDNYKDQIEIAKAFGLRRREIIGDDFSIKEDNLFLEDDKVYCGTIGKGGKYRESLCLEEYKDAIIEKYDVGERSFYDKTSFIETYTDESEYLFDEYTEKIDNHAFRGEYARALYDELKAEREELGEVEEDYRGYNKEIVLKVSQSLGHERPDVAVENYFT